MKNASFIVMLGGVSVFFFILATFSNPSQNFFFDSPDETANYFWATRVANGESLWYEELLEDAGNALLRPRSMNIVGTHVAPGSFAGLPLLYGYIATLSGERAIPYLTQLFASLALLAFGLLTARLFGRPVGLLSAALLAFLPPWWYYTARGMYHNILFTSLFVIGLTLLIYLVTSKHARRAGLRIIGWGIAGLVFGYALIVRSSEAGWMTVLVISILLSSFIADRMQQKKIHITLSGLLMFIACGLFALTPLFTTNIALYGTPIAIGYRGAWGQEFGEFLRNLPAPEYRNLFFAPFGIKLGQLRIAVKNFLVDYLPWWFWPIVLGKALIAALIVLRGIILNWRGEVRGSAKKIFQLSEGARSWTWTWYSVLYLFMTALLIIYYGSWEFSDRIDGQTVSLNTSLFRYWLPVYVMGIPFISALVVWLRSLFLWRGVRVLITIVAIGLFAYPSAALVLNDTDESLLMVRARMRAAAFEREAVRRVVSQDAVIITYPQADKVLFPEYKRLITALMHEEDYRAVQRILGMGIPVYYYTYAPPDDAAAEGIRQFAPHGLALTNPVKGFKNKWIWKIVQGE